MEKGFWVVTVTRRHLVLAACAVGLVIGLWQGTRTASFSAGTLPAAVDPVAAQPLSQDRPVRQVPHAKGKMALTINVDWGNEVIPDMLDVLEQRGVRATFFLTGRWAARFPEMARMIAERGHEIGNHGQSHAHPTQLSDQALRQHIAGNVSVLREAIGREPVPLYAPPYGEQNERVVAAAKEHGHWTTLWTLDTIDWQDPAPATIVQRIVPRAADGAIVLMHPKPQSLEALPAIIDGVRAAGFEWVPLYEMIQSAM